MAQICLGAFHHRAFKRNPTPTILSTIHRILGPIIIFLGIVNGALSVFPSLSILTPPLNP